MDRLNRMAIELVDEAVDFADELNIGVVELENDATVLDFGVDFPGGIEAGLLLAEIQTAGLATVQTTMDTVSGTPLPYVELFTDNPALALLGSHTARWEVAVDGYEALGSGPARALRAEDPLYHAIEYHDEFDLTVLALEAATLPSAAVATEIAAATGVDPAGVYLPTAPAASLSGTVGAAARAAEVSVVQLYEHGYDPTAIHSVSATAPVPPVAATERTAISRGTDTIAYGSHVHLVVEEDSDVFEAVPSTARTRHGTPFETIFGDVDWDTNALAPGVFGPGLLTVDIRGGGTRTFGTTDEDILAAGFGIAE